MPAPQRPAQKPIVKRSLLSWIFGPNTKLQLLLLLVILFTVFVRVVPLEMQKRIVNNAIKLRNIDLLFIYCGIYLAAVTFDGLLKYIINIIQTIVSQRTTAHMRKDLFKHIITLPLGFFRNTQPGTVVNALSGELTIPGNFVGMAIATPVTNILTLLAFAGYLVWLNLWLALLSLSIYPIVVFLVPILQKRVNKANKKRVDKARQLASRVAESISGIHEIQANGAYPIENNKFGKIVDKLYKIRIVWSLYRFGIKTLNNYFTNLGPFIVFILGGYLSIKGRLELGALVAFLSAQEKLYNPWKELIEFYQVYQDGQVNYNRTMEFFDKEPDHLLEPDQRGVVTLDGNIEVKDLRFLTDSGLELLGGINLNLKAGEHLAIVGFSGSGKSTLAQCIGQLYAYSSGHVFIDNHEVSELTKKDMAQNLGFVSQSPLIFTGSIEENLLYATSAASWDNENQQAAHLPSLDDIIAVLQQTGIFVDVLRFGLNTVLSDHKYGTLIETLIKVRSNFQQDFGQALADYVEFYDENKYLFHSTVADNLILGAARRETFEPHNLHHNDYFLDFLKEADLTRPLLGLGAHLSRQTVDILGDISPDPVLFAQSPIAPEELDTFKEVVNRLKKLKLHQLDEKDQKRLLDLALRFIPGQHKMAGLPEMLKGLILDSRVMFREKISVDDPEAFAFYDINQYIHSQSILNNIFFGTTTTANPLAQEKINQSIIQLLIEEDILEAIVKIGMQFQVGSQGDKLSGGQRQKLAIARAFLKEPTLLIMDEATSALDNKSQTRIQNLLTNRYKGKSTLVAVVHRLDTIKTFDKIAVMKAGKIGEMGTYDDLIAQKGMLYELVYGKRA